jgi:hypothetical protein
LGTYPESSLLWLGAFGADVEVDPASELTASRAGEIDWLAAAGDVVEADEPVALLGQRQIAHSAAQLAIDESQLTLRLRAVRWNHREKKAGLERQIEEVRSRIRKLEMTPEERQLLGAEMERRIEEQRGELNRQIEEINEKLDPEHLAEELRLELAQLEQDVRRARFDHEELIRSMEVHAEHDGVLEIDLEGYVRANQVIGRIRRSGHAVVALQVVDPEIRSEPPDSLVITVVGPDGTPRQGRFNRIDRGYGGRLSAVTYFFDLSADDGGDLPTELTGERMATVYRQLPQPARIVPKSQLLFAHAAEINRLGWAGFMKTIYPEARILHIGPQAIAMVPES